jgi:phage-related protein
MKAFLPLSDDLITAPPFSPRGPGRGHLLMLVQMGESIGMPRSRPIPDIGPRCHELRIRDRDTNWRIFYRTDPDTVLIVHIMGKATRATPRRAIELCRARLAAYDRAARGGD